MNLLVCMKQVPEKDSRYKVNDLGTWVREEDLVFETNESDQYALEEALRLREKLGGEVTVISLGAVRAQKTLKSALAMGADRAVHVSSEQLQQSDASVIAKVIQRAIQGEQFDLIFTGVQSDDMSFAQTGTIQLLTGHKAKGLEFGDVYHLDPWLCKDSEQDRNLSYVISTRSQDRLTEVDSTGIDWSA